MDPAEETLISASLLPHGDGVQLDVRPVGAAGAAGKPSGGCAGSGSAGGTSASADLPLEAPAEPLSPAAAPGTPPALIRTELPAADQGQPSQPMQVEGVQGGQGGQEGAGATTPLQHASGSGSVWEEAQAHAEHSPLAAEAGQVAAKAVQHIFLWLTAAAFLLSRAFHQASTFPLAAGRLVASAACAAADALHRHGSAFKRQLSAKASAAQTAASSAASAAWGWLTSPIESMPDINRGQLLAAALGCMLALSTAYCAGLAKADVASKRAQLQHAPKATPPAATPTGIIAANGTCVCSPVGQPEPGDMSGVSEHISTGRPGSAGGSEEGQPGSSADVLQAVQHTAAAAYSNDVSPSAQPDPAGPVSDHACPRLAAGSGSCLTATLALISAGDAETPQAAQAHHDNATHPHAPGASHSIAAAMRRGLAAAGDSVGISVRAAAASGRRSWEAAVGIVRSADGIARWEPLQAKAASLGSALGLGNSDSPSPLRYLSYAPVVCAGLLAGYLGAFKVAGLGWQAWQRWGGG